MLPTMRRFCFISMTLLLSFCLAGQRNKQRVVEDGGKKFLYTDSAGVTQSYISYFSDSLPVPDLVTIDKKLIPTSVRKGKTIVYNFWFVSCRPCVSEIPALNQLVKKYQSDSTLFIAVTFDTENRINAFLQNHEFAFQIVRLSQMEIDKIKKISFYPFTAIVTREGKLSFALFGRPAGKNSETAIFDLLDKQIGKALL